MKKLLPVLVLALALLAAGCGGGGDEAAGTGGATATGADTGGGGAAADCSGAIGIMAPITGEAGAIGTEQLNWAKFAVSRFNEENGTSFTLVEGDTQLDPAQASTVAQRFASNDEILAVVGPAGSQEVEAVAPLFTRADLAFVSGSATATDLTNGDNPTFYRVVPNDGAQAPTAATYIAEELDAQNVVIIDDQTSYSRPLADGVQTALEEADVTVSRQSVNQDQTDFSSLVSRVPQDADVVFLPWQIAANAQIFGQQMREQGREAVIFGSDGLFSPEDFKIDGSYVSSFAPDIRNIEESQELAEAFTAEYGDFGTFGPPTYAATYVVMTALQTLCERGDEPTREAVVEEIGQTNVQGSILGGDLSFDENGDPEGAEFYIFRIEDGEYTLVTE
ncbi:MAG TPA: branched-chain amino acid ABC transporter substrate-binding protein [Gaiellaceae bacterium]|nr:branched-chain amino acid ABC transporter substrate-binding protein [Gaiellaceae bacterium]